MLRAPVTPSGTMAHTIVLLSGTSSTSPYARLTGYMESVELGVIEVTERAGLNLLRIHPSQLHTSGAAPVVRERPMGVVVPHWVGEAWRDAEFYAPFRDFGIPLVVNGDGPHLQAFDRVVPDHEAGAYDLTRWVMGRGCARILRVWSAEADSYWMRMRNAGHERALAEAHASALPPVDMAELRAVTGSIIDDPSKAYRAGVRLIAGCLSEHAVGKRREIDALMFTTDVEARMGAEACELLGIAPNRDVLIVGYDNTAFDQSAPLEGARGPVATVDKRNVDMGRAMTELLIDRIEGRLGEGPARVLMRPSLLTCTVP